MSHARRPDDPVAAAQKCAAYDPLSVLARGGVREASGDVEDQIAPAPSSGEFSDPILHHILRVDLQSVRKAVASDDPGHGTPTEVQVHGVGSQANVEPRFHAGTEHGCARAVHQIVEQIVRKAPPELAGHSTNTVAGSK